MKKNTMKIQSPVNRKDFVGGCIGVILALMLAVLALPISLAASSTSDDLSVLNIEFLNQVPDPVEPGSYVDLRWRVTNLGGKSADYVFELDAEYPFSFDVASDGKLSSKSVGSYDATESGATLYYRVRVADDAVEGSLNEVTLKYYRADKSGTESSIEHPVRIESRQGLVNIENVRVSPNQASIGSVFNISLDIENFGTGFISNVKVALDTDDLGLVPFGTSSQRLLSQISGKSSKTLTFQYFVDSTSDIKVISIPVSVIYYDSLGRENTVESNIGVQISADPSYFANLDKSDVYMADSKGKIVSSISNTGKSDINFAILELLETPDYVVVGPSTSYLGNLKSDDLQTGQFDIYVLPNNDSSVPLSFKLTYKDVYDQQHVTYFFLSNKLYTDDLAIKVGLKSAGGSGGIIIVIVIVLAIGCFWWYRSAKKKNAKNAKN